MSEIRLHIYGIDDKGKMKDVGSLLINNIRLLVEKKGDDKYSLTELLFIPSILAKTSYISNRYRIKCSPTNEDLAYQLQISFRPNAGIILGTEGPVNIDVITTLSKFRPDH